MTQSIKRNQLDDPLLSSQLNDASSILDEAAQAGEQASDQIDRGQTPQAIEQQEIVQDRIGELLSILDRGQDSYLALRSIQQLRDNIESIRNDTAELNAQTAGRSLDQLSQEERSTLDRILERQLDAADVARRCGEGTQRPARRTLAPSGGTDRVQPNILRYEHTN